MKKSIKRLICVMLACMMFITTAFALTGNKTLEAKDIEVEVYAENLSAEKIEYIKQAFQGTTLTASIAPQLA